MTHDTRYNGWRNYATWCVNLDIFDGLDDAPADGESCKDWAEEMIFMEIPDGLAKQYARAFLSDVDWQEIADAHHRSKPTATGAPVKTDDEIWADSERNVTRSMREIDSCVVCGRTLRPDRQHTDTCKGSCFARLRRVQLKYGEGI